MRVWSPRRGRCFTRCPGKNFDGLDNWYSPPSHEYFDDSILAARRRWDLMLHPISRRPTAPVLLASSLLARCYRRFTRISASRSTECVRPTRSRWSAAGAPVLSRLSASHRDRSSCVAFRSKDHGRGDLLHERRNGHFLLQVTGHPSYGLPWGQDRLVQIFLATLAVRQQRKRITFRSTA